MRIFNQFYIKSYLTPTHYKKRLTAHIEPQRLSFEEAKDRQTRLANLYSAVVIYAAKDGREVSNLINI